MSGWQSLGIFSEHFLCVCTPQSATTHKIILSSPYPHNNETLFFSSLFLREQFFLNRAIIVRPSCSCNLIVTAPLSQRKHWLVIVCLFVYSPYRNICKSKSDEKRFNKMDIKILFICFYPTNVAISLKS
jgi:hypothetical protein